MGKKEIISSENKKKTFFLSEHPIRITPRHCHMNPKNIVLSCNFHITLNRIPHPYKPLH